MSSIKTMSKLNAKKMHLLPFLLRSSHEPCNIYRKCHRLYILFLKDDNSETRILALNIWMAFQGNLFHTEGAFQLNWTPPLKSCKFSTKKSESCCKEIGCGGEYAQIFSVSFLLQRDNLTIFCLNTFHFENVSELDFCNDWAGFKTGGKTFGNWLSWWSEWWKIRKKFFF